MKLNSMQHIPLASAYLCPNCGCVGNCSERCPACASTALLGLASILDREPEEATQPEFPFCFPGCDPMYPHQLASSGAVLAELSTVVPPIVGQDAAAFVESAVAFSGAAAIFALTTGIFFTEAFFVAAAFLTGSTLG